MKRKSAILGLLLQPMLKRSLVLATNAVFYFALVSHGNHQMRERVADLKAAEAKGISFDLRWWTPWPTAIAHGINLPAVVPSYAIFYATGLMSPSDFTEPPPASGFLLVTASTFWWFFIPFVGRKIRAGIPSASSQGIWKIVVSSIICTLAGLAWLWGAKRQFEQVPQGVPSKLCGLLLNRNTPSARSSFSCGSPSAFSLLRSQQQVQAEAVVAILVISAEACRIEASVVGLQVGRTKFG